QQQGAEECGRPLGAVRTPEHDAVALRDALRAEVAGDAPGRVKQLGVVPTPWLVVVKGDRRKCRPLGGRRFQHVYQRLQMALPVSDRAVRSWSSWSSLWSSSWSSARS